MRCQRSERRCPHVAVFVDAAGSYGRGLLEGIANYLERHGPWSLFLQSHATGTFDLACLRGWRGDGVLAFVEERSVLLRLRRLRIPLVETYGHRPELKVPHVGNDDAAIGRLGAEHLLSRRFERFAFSGYPGHLWVQWRWEGFAAAVRKAGFVPQLNLHPRAVATPRAWEMAQQRLAAWLTGMPKPLGLMACSDRHALNLLDACNRAGLSVPADVAVLGVDNDRTICGLSNPPLSSVADNPWKVGFNAAKLLDGLMAGKRIVRTGKSLLIQPTGVVARRSTDFTFAADPIVRATIQYIREHAAENINIKTILRTRSISRSALYRRFQRAMGRSLHEELLGARLERVKHLLTQTSTPVGRIARMAGFQHAAYLGAVFKKRCGVTPGQFRASFQRKTRGAV